MTEELRSGVNGKVRQAMQESIARILVGVDGSLTIEAKPEGLLGVEGTHAHLTDVREESAMIRQAISSSSGRQFMVKTKYLYGVVESLLDEDAENDGRGSLQAVMGYAPYLNTASRMAL
jgi:hypothetical protein